MADLLTENDIEILYVQANDLRYSALVREKATGLLTEYVFPLGQPPTSEQILSRVNRVELARREAGR